MASMTGADVALAYQSQLGSDIAVSFNGPLLAGGAITSAQSYAVFLRKILNGQLQIAGLLGYQKTCTLPGTCATAEYSPLPANWSYSVGHWVEDDPVVGDGAFSSPGAFGFYPWIDASKTGYGILARHANVSITGDDPVAVESVVCGRLIRKAWSTATAQ